MLLLSVFSCAALCGQWQADAMAIGGKDCVAAVDSRAARQLQLCQVPNQPDNKGHAAERHRTRPVPCHAFSLATATSASEQASCRQEH